MGRKKIDQRHEEAVKAIEKALRDSQFQVGLSSLHNSLKAHEAKRLQVRKQGDPSAAFSNWNWRNITVEQGRAQHSGPYYDLRELCDNFDLPWPESGELLLALSGPSAFDVPDLPSKQAWQAWRMARTGLGRPQPDEVAQARDLLGDYTPHDRRRRFDWGLTQDAVAYILNVDERTVRQWIGDCRRYAQVGNLNEIAEAAGLTGGELVVLMIARLIEEKPEE